MARRDPIDEATAALLRDGEVKRAKGLTPGAKRKALKDGKRNKATYDLPEQIVRRIREIAEEEGCPQSGVATVFLLDAIRRYDEREVDLARFKSPSDSPKYDHVIEVPDEELP